MESRRELSSTLQERKKADVTHLLVRSDQSTDEVSLSIHVDEADVAHDSLAVVLDLGEAVLYSLVVVDGLLLAVDVLESVDEAV